VSHPLATCKGESGVVTCPLKSDCKGDKCVSCEGTKGGWGCGNIMLCPDGILSDVPAWPGLEAMALAWLFMAQAWQNPRPCPSVVMLRVHALGSAR
jgi:hypothetical protein